MNTPLEARIARSRCKVCLV